ncbi:hypothetical protein L861_13500 [Litchfieldella anticariensis FP35 = DSM 16096]|uniref:DUF1240 domain-containing protein n=1 Tax=Litchfieldella anticariensis (strain DSM 16096 / CECT 5854 / CIP 108499 / LMG 22089 / FP35) TaxID=1121939 RepID=S2KFV9_LITA3|nr:hypothetical protein L861_13500 [Halomonas anticariensis FP35 = DSM 16096]
MTGKQWALTVFGLMLPVVLVGVQVWLGGIGIITQPFRPLEPKVLLLFYPGYMAMVTGFPLCVWLFWMNLRRVLTRQWIAPRKQSRRDTMTTIVLIAVAIISILPRYYLGIRIDTAGYVHCQEEARTSLKSSWRVYAESETLCENARRR